MTVETAPFINSLDATYPASGDAKSEGDNHLRLIKSAVKATFPNVTGAVTPTHTQLNTVPDLAPKASPTFTGTPVAPTAATTDNSTQLATTALVSAKIVAAALSAELPSQAGNAGKVIKTDGTNASWGAISLASSVRTSNTILGAADQSNLIDITSGTFSQTFDAAATLGDGWFVYLKNSGTGVITLDPNASELIDGSATLALNPGFMALVTCSGTALNTVLFTPNIGDHAVKVMTGNGHGSTSNKIRRFTTTEYSTGSHIAYADSATLGASFTVASGGAGLYAIQYSDGNINTADTHGVSLNSSQLTTAIGSITNENRLARTISDALLWNACNCVVRLVVGDVIRPHTTGTNDQTTAANVWFSIRKIGL